MTLPLIFLGKIVSQISRMLNIGSGGTWPGEIALSLDKNILNQFLTKVKKGIIIVAGTNGKTTTAKMIQSIIEKSNKSMDTKIVHNDSGANLLNGLVSAFIKKASWNGTVDIDWAILEVDENTLTPLISNIKNKISKINIKNQKYIIVLLNLFRDQLDRYGEVDAIASKWEKSLIGLDSNSTLILNADDPQIAYLGKHTKAKTIYFGLDKPDEFIKTKEHATDSTYCRNCGSKLEYKGIYYSHIGVWNCPKCGSKRPKLKLSQWKPNLPGLYNQYNTLAAVLVGDELAITDKEIKSSLKSFSPAFGRQEEIIVDGKKVKIFLSKNPAGYNASLRTVIELGAKHMLLVLNDRIPDGRDVSWIWDVDFELIPENTQITISGDRAYDMGLRIKYADRSQIYNLKTQNQNPKLKIYESLKQAIEVSLDTLNHGDTLYILATYSAMLDTRKILKGRKIL